MIEFLQNSIFAQIGIIIIIAALVSFLIRLTKQPLIPAYIISGIILGPLLLGLIKEPQLINSLSEIGIAFLIFSAGLEINFKKLREVGKTILIGGLIQILALFFIGFWIASAIGFSGKIPAYIGLIIAFSSTMVVLKILYDKREINSLHGRIIIGILLIQDLAAISALLILKTDFSINQIVIELFKTGIFLILTLFLSKVANPILKKSENSPELLLLVSISFLFLFTIGSYSSELPLAIGAFFAGVALANSNYKVEIEGKVAPIRDFFAAIFFVSLGMQITGFSNNFFVLILILIAAVLIIKPLIIMISVRLLGYTKRTAFLSGNALAQTSEFSFIIAALGFSLGHISKELFSALVLLSVITMSLTTYFIEHEKKFYKAFGWILNPLEGIRSKKERFEYLEKKHEIIIFGCHRIGSLFLKEFIKEKKKVLVIDYNPEIIRALIKKKIPCIYGDFMNEEILEKANLKKSKMIISSIPDVEDNIVLIKKAKRVNKELLVFIIANRISEALALYNAGADYVIMPMIIGAQKGFEIMDKIKDKKAGLKELKKEHIEYLNSIHRLLY